MPLPTPVNLLSKFTLRPRLPDDILYLIAQFSTFETRVSLVRCNKWLHRNCTSLLFKDIYLYSPLQLIELLINEETMRMLSRTDSIYFDESIFSCDSWPSEFVEVAPDVIVAVLGATNSLSRLQIFRSKEITTNEPEDPRLALENCLRTYPFDRKLEQKIDSAASNPELLPNLKIIIEHPDSISFRKFCPGRPVIYYYHRVDPYMHVDICPGVGEPGSALSLQRNLSAHEVGTLIRESNFSGPSEFATSGIIIRMRFPEEIERKTQGPVQDTLSWTKAMLAASEIPFDELHCLEVSFKPKPPYLTPAAQLVLVEELWEDFPDLEEISISYPEFLWSKNVDHGHYKSKYFPDDPLPEWTPSPFELYTLDRNWMDWWLKELGLDSQKA